MTTEVQAVVRALDGEFAEVEANPQATCGSCHSGGSCGTSLFASALSSGRRRVRVSNPVAARVGDLVMLEFDERRVPKLSLWLYGLPLLGLIVGALLPLRLQLGGEPASVIGGLFGMLGVLYWLKGRQARLLNNGDALPVIRRRLLAPKP